MINGYNDEGKDCPKDQTIEQKRQRPDNRSK